MSCKIMGILNLTEDSFFDGGKYIHEQSQLKRVQQMIEEGVDLIDVGAMSAKPGSFEISENEEIDRITRIVRLIRKEFSDVKISVDTYRSSVAQVAIEEGCDMINDISGGIFDPEIFDVLARHQKAYVMMHTSAMPHKMQNMTQYGNIVNDIIDFFKKQIKLLRDKGFAGEIIIDQGFGFGKTIEQNYVLLSNLQQFRLFDCPILVGVSRKSMIYKLLNTTPQAALNGTTVVNTLALMNGADYLRVHDVKEAVEARNIYEQYKRSKS